MDKVLKLYKIPERDEIVSVLQVSDDSSLPESTTAGQLSINYDNVYGYRLWNSVEIGGELDWVDIPFDLSVYYRDISASVPKFYYAYEVSQGNYGVFEYDISFPTNSRLAEIYDFTYSANRMGNAPSISATLEYRTCLDELWTDRVCTYFNSVFFFIDKTPTSSYDNSKQLYKHQISFNSEHLLLEKVFFVNVVNAQTVSSDDVSHWLEFSFFGDIEQFVARLNQSMAYTGLDTLGFNIVVDSDVQSMTFDEPEKLVGISDTTIKAALDMLYELWGVPYYYDGYTIHIGFSNSAIMPQGVTMPTFRYGAQYSLLSIQKSQSNDIVNRMAGFGESDNLPYFYPNENPNNLELQYIHEQTMMLNYARIANPYRLVNIEPSDAVHQGVPSGTYFKYMPITKTHTYDQFVTINPNYEARLAEDEDGVPVLVNEPQQSDDTVMLYQFFPPTTQGGDAKVIKKMFIWFGDKIVDTATIKDHADFYPFQSHCYSGSFVAAPLLCTREQWRAMSENNIGYTYGNPRVQLSYTINHSVNAQTGIETVTYSWSDGTTTTGSYDIQNNEYTENGYDAKFPLELSNIPSSYKGFLVVHTINIPYSLWFNGINSELPLSKTWETYLRTDTRSSVKIQYSNSNDWSLNADGHSVNLYRYGIRLNAGITPSLNDIIYFTKSADAKPYMDRLLPYSYRQTGDMWLNALNNTYEKQDSQDYYEFENQYKLTAIREAVETFEDIKPTIKGMTNSDSPAVRIDKFRAIAYDANDNNEVDAEGNYLHPYFYVKLAKTDFENAYSFNLFDCAIEGSVMQISMTSGNCGGCTFDVMVKYGKDGFARNPIAVFEQATTINGVTYAAGTPKRSPKTGDVLVNQYQDQQQDTSAQEVWIALKKDNETFSGQTLPDLKAQDPLDPDPTSTTAILPSTNDTFVILNINLPFAYVIAAEQRLYYATLDKLQEDNIRKWSFSIKFSSIYYKQRYELMDKWLNEASLVPFIYNNITRQYYVQSYTYKMTKDKALPEVNIELQEKLRKKTTYYIPTAENQYLSAPYIPSSVEKRLRTIVNNAMTAQSQSVSSRTFDNVQIEGDITLKDGTSLNAQIVALNDRIFSSEKSRTRELAWSEVGKRAEIENLFVDGIFATSFNSETTSGVRIQENGSGIVGKNSIKATFEDNSSYFTFDQKVSVEELESYTVAFYVKSSNGSSIQVEAAQFDDQNNKLEKNSADFDIDSAWSQKAFSFDTVTDASYIVIKITYGGDETAVPVDFDGISVYADDYMTYDQGGNLVASPLLPAKYKMSAADVFNAIKNLNI